MDPYDYDELYCDDGRYDDDPNPYHGDYSEEQARNRTDSPRFGGYIKAPPSYKPSSQDV